jgi:CRP-like cAMP-binding protein
MTASSLLSRTDNGTVTALSQSTLLSIGHRNALLAALPDADFRRLAPHLEDVALRRGQVLTEEGQEIRHFHFPIRGAISLVIITGSGEAAETTAIGPEGVVSFPRLLGHRYAPARSIVQVSGTAVRIECDHLMRLMGPGSRLHGVLQFYLGALLAQVLRASACNALHSVEQRRACWLLMAHDRACADSFDLTQSLLSEMLGVRRATVSVVCASFQRAGLIALHRGAIEMTGRRRLEGVACGCNAAIRGLLDRALVPP